MRELTLDIRCKETGYNGGIRGLPHYHEASHEMDNDHCVPTVYAEVNATCSQWQTVCGLKALKHM